MTKFVIELTKEQRNVLDAVVWSGHQENDPFNRVLSDEMVVGDVTLVASLNVYHNGMGDPGSYYLEVFDVNDFDGLYADSNGFSDEIRDGMLVNMRTMIGNESFSVELRYV